MYLKTDLTLYKSMEVSYVVIRSILGPPLNVPALIEWLALQKTKPLKRGMFG